MKSKDWHYDELDGKDYMTMQNLDIMPTLDYQSESYKDAYSRINAIVIEGEQEAHENYRKLAELLPESKDDLLRLAKMENRHKKGFQACGRNLEVTPDMARMPRAIALAKATPMTVSSSASARSRSPSGQTSWERVTSRRSPSSSRPVIR